MRLQWKKTKYLFKVIDLVREEITKAVYDEMMSDVFFTVIVDKTKSSKSEQLSVCIRYTEKPQVKE